MPLLVRMHILGFLPQALSSAGLVIDGIGHPYRTRARLSASVSQHTVKLHQTRHPLGTRIPALCALGSGTRRKQRQRPQHTKSPGSNPGKFLAQELASSMGQNFTHAANTSRLVTVRYSFKPSFQGRKTFLLIDFKPLRSRASA